MSRRRRRFRARRRTPTSVALPSRPLRSFEARVETLVYLAQGRSAPYIADEQFLSVNTVRTHIKRIYAKMDVHSKEELLDLFHKS